jgi:Sulfotransferase family
LYVMGMSRSGTTLMGQILGQVPGLAYAGELRWLWDKAQMGGLCGCGLPLLECPVWSKVLANTAQPMSPLDHAAFASKLGSKVVGRTHTWVRASALGLARRMPGRSRTAVARYGQSLVDADSSFLIQVGQDWVVDSSSEPSDAALLAGLAAVDLRIVHLVRDPRGVVYSHHRASRARPGWRQRLSTAYLAAAWVAANLAARQVLRHVGPARSMQIRYEDLMRDPVQGIGRAVTLTGRSVPDGLINDRKVGIDVCHTVAGNPGRFRNGQIALEEDVAWRSELPSVDRRIIDLLCRPVARFYRYT